MISKNLSKKPIKQIMWTKIFHHLHYPMARQVRSIEQMMRLLYEENLTCLRAQIYDEIDGKTNERL